MVQIRRGFRRNSPTRAFSNEASIWREPPIAAPVSAPGGPAYSGGLAFVLPFGTLYATNITPDKETGIGDYSDVEFLSALRKGIRRDGARLYPAMPFVDYSMMTDADALAIKAYLFSVQPVRAPARTNTLAFPFDQRPLMGVWALLFDRDKRFEPHSQRSAQWNRGAYLVETMAHCGECHTPRNLFQALDNRAKFAGAVQAGWRAYNITTDPPAASAIGAPQTSRTIWRSAMPTSMARRPVPWARRSTKVSVT